MDSQQLKKRKLEATAVATSKNDMVNLLHQFDKEVQRQTAVELTDNDTVQKSLHQLEEDMNTIRGCLEKKRAKITLVDINTKLDTILAILNQNGFGYDLASTNEQN